VKRRFRVTVAGRTFEVEVEEIGGGEVAEAAPSAPAAPTPQAAPAPRAEEAPPEVEVAGEAVVAPLPGTVKSIMVRENDVVNAGDVLLVLETMKMENEIYAPKSGVVRKVAVRENQDVNYGDVLVIIG